MQAVLGIVTVKRRGFVHIACYDMQYAEPLPVMILDSVR